MAPKQKEIKILVVDRFPAIREGIRTMLTLPDNPFNYIVDESGIAEDALKKVKKNHYDIVLVAYELPQVTGYQLTTRLIEMSPSLKILGISEFDEYSYIKDMINAGAMGYLLKTIDAVELNLIIEMTFEAGEDFDHVFVPKQHMSSVENMATPLFQLKKRNYYTSETKPVKFKKLTLTKREKQIVQLLARNKSSKEIGEKFQIGSRTVDNFRANLLKKFNVKNTSSLVQYVVKLGLIKHKIKKGKQKK